jgi:hypothetical protein
MDFMSFSDQIENQYEGKMRRVETFLKEISRLNESGIYNMRDISKKYKKAEIYFHIDLDGVTSAIGMKQYLKNYGITTVDAHTVQYGSKEYAIPFPKGGVLPVLVDFAHGKPMMVIHTDHHDHQVGVEKGQSTSFVVSPSNAEYISHVLSPNDLFPPSDSKIISMVDSAGFAAKGMTPDDIMRAIFTLDGKKTVEKNKEAMGLVVNKLLLAYKNKPGFLEELVLRANPSLLSMFHIIIDLARKNGYKSPKEVEDDGKRYVADQKSKSKGKGSISDIQSLGNGESVMVGNVLFQWGGGNMMKGGYDRYTPFKNNPDAHYLCIGWPMGLVQVSKNPFMSKRNPYNLGDLVLKKVMPKFKSELSRRRVNLEYMKWVMENDKSFSKDSVGFTMKDVVSLFTPEQIRGIDVEAEGGKKGQWKELIFDLMSRPLSTLSYKQKQLLKNIEIPVWDIIIAGSGGHKDITNVSNLGFVSKNYTAFMRDLMTEIGKEMKDMELQ